MRRADLGAPEGGSAMGLIERLSATSDAIPWGWLWFGACLGHGFWMTIAVNVVYSHALPHKLLRVLRKIDVLFILLGPALFLIALDVLGEQRLAWFADGPRRLLAPYTLACFVLGLGVAPVCQLLYWLRRTAPQQTDVKAETVDVAKVLGHAPVGSGRDAYKCLWPGNQVFQVEFTRKTLTLPQLPAEWDGVTILHLTDLHFCGTPDREFFRAAFDHALRDGPPDLVALTGDVVDSAWHHRWIAPLLGRVTARESRWAILGNHDHYRDVTLVRRRLRRVGFRVLENGWAETTLRGLPLVVVGHEGPWLQPVPDLAGCPDGPFRLCLSHSPDPIAWARKQRIDLMLAGHVHGGQLRLPLIGSTFCPSRYSRRYDCGTFFEPPTVLHVSRGLSGQHPLRYRCKPEITTLVLRGS